MIASQTSVEPISYLVVIFSSWQFVLLSVRLLARICNKNQHNRQALSKQNSVMDFKMVA